MKKTLLCIAALFLATAASAAEYRVVAHPLVRVTSLTKTDAATIFKKRMPKWPDGTPIVVVDQLETSTARIRFTEEVIGKSMAAMHSYWQQQIFSGREVPPAEKGSDAEVVAFVRSNPGAVGYVSSNASTAGLTVIEIR